ncbi:MAG TPA: DUF1385 domain-containing protein [Actinomycetota bacterium]|nr:DUF1385 domain-containing protein [Actinomycetota bacterium]
MSEVAAPARVRLGGMALPDGVYIRSNKAWAIARTDGSVETGLVQQTKTSTVPVVRVLAALAAGMQAVVRSAKGNPQGMRSTQRFAFVIVVLSAAHWLLARYLGFDQGIGRAMIDPLFGAVVLGSMRILMPAALWRHHGAEHKAITAHEQGVDLGDLRGVARVTAIHDRCGTNLVAILFLVTAVPLPRGPLGVVAPLVMVASAAELLALAMRRAGGTRFTRAILAPGRFLQRAVTIREPSPEELLVGVRAVEACLSEHAAAVRAESPRPVAA